MMDTVALYRSELWHNVSDRNEFYTSTAVQAAPGTPNNERKPRYSFVARILTKRHISDADARQNQATHGRLLRNVTE